MLFLALFYKQAQEDRCRCFI